MKTETNKNDLVKENKTHEFVRCCHKCNTLSSDYHEVKKCGNCGQSFLPTNYFKKVHSLKGVDYDDLYDSVSNIDPSLLLKGLTVIW